MSVVVGRAVGVAECCVRQVVDVRVSRKSEDIVPSRRISAHGHGVCMISRNDDQSILFTLRADRFLNSFRELHSFMQRSTGLPTVLLENLDYIAILFFKRNEFCLKRTRRFYQRKPTHYNSGGVSAIKKAYKGVWLSVDIEKEYSSSIFLSTHSFYHGPSRKTDLLMLPVENRYIKTYFNLNLNILNKIWYEFNKI